jgi:ribosomal protein L24
VSLSHIGVFSQDFINSIAAAVEDLMISGGEVKKTVKRTFSILVEGLQNIHRHGSLDEKGRQLAFLILAKNIKTYKIVLGNIIDDEDAEPVSNYLTRINSMSHDQLKLVYLDVLSREPLTKKGGAGLGFLTMSIKSESELKYSIQTIANGKSILFVEILLNRG